MNKSGYLFIKKNFFPFFLVETHCKSLLGSQELHDITQHHRIVYGQQHLGKVPMQFYLLTSILLKMISHESRDALVFSGLLILSMVWIECLLDALVFEINSSLST